MYIVLKFDNFFRDWFLFTMALVDVLKCIYFSSNWVTHGPSAIINWFAETHWDNCSLGWSLVQFEFFNIDWCVLLYIVFASTLSLSWFSYFCSMFPKSTHGTFSTKLFQHFPSHARLAKAKFSETDFTISHYAGKACHISQHFPNDSYNLMLIIINFYCRLLITRILF